MTNTHISTFKKALRNSAGLFSFVALLLQLCGLSTNAQNVSSKIITHTVNNNPTDNAILVKHDDGIYTLHEEVGDKDRNRLFVTKHGLKGELIWKQLFSFNAPVGLGFAVVSGEKLIVACVYNNSEDYPNEPNGVLVFELYRDGSFGNVSIFNPQSYVVLQLSTFGARLPNGRIGSVGLVRSKSFGYTYISYLEFDKYGELSFISPSYVTEPNITMPFAVNELGEKIYWLNKSYNRIDPGSGSLTSMNMKTTAPDPIQIESISGDEYFMLLGGDGPRKLMRFNIKGPYQRYPERVLCTYPATHFSYDREQSLITLYGKTSIAVIDTLGNLLHSFKIPALGNSGTAIGTEGIDEERIIVGTKNGAGAAYFYGFMNPASALACSSDTSPVGTAPRVVHDFVSGGFGSLFKDTGINSYSTSLSVIPQQVATDTFCFAANCHYFELPDDSVLCGGQSFECFPVLSVPEFGTTNFSWSDGNPELNRFIRSSGTYVLTATDNGCTQKDSVEIFFEDYHICGHQIYIPDAFTPDADDKNDIFSPVLTDIYKFNFEIFDKWGRRIFVSKDYVEGWDGKHQGSEMPSGIYPWILKYRTIQDPSAEQVIMGRVCLFR